jgi:hypothetical protein
LQEMDLRAVGQRFVGPNELPGVPTVTPPSKFDLPTSAAVITTKRFHTINFESGKQTCICLRELLSSTLPRQRTGLSFRQNEGEASVSFATLDAAGGTTSRETSKPPRLRGSTHEYNKWNRKRSDGRTRVHEQKGNALAAVGSKRRRRKHHQLVLSHASA